ncbi:MAG: HAMP domain-containing protein [Clostridia bacterium]|nr:HAMP domain-containing protein [Clostridia bacterium]MBR6524132.1 HAMP domain-containing protein [Clostridia bacterium]
MFRRMQWKIVCIFVALVFAIMLFVGIYMFGSIIRLYSDDFRIQMDKVMSGSFSEVMFETLNSDLSKEDRAARINTVISAYSSQLGLSEQRQCAVLDAKDASRIVTTGTGVDALEKTPNIIQAMTGGVGRSIRSNAAYMDYAYFLDGKPGESGYIIYVRDNKQNANTLTSNMLYIIVQALLFGVLASVFLGYFLSKTISKPISVLTEKAEDFAEGNFESNLEPQSHDEIGTLVETFNYMGGVMKTALNDVATEKHKLEIILEHINNGIIAFNTSQEIISINMTAKNMFRLDNTDEIRFDKFFEELNSDVCMAEFMYLTRFRTEIRDIEVNNKHIKAYFLPFKFEDERVAGVVCVFSDITEQFNLELSRRKFVAEVSHELKTPLTTIGTYTETLLDNYPVGDEMTISFLNTIHNETDKMTSLVKNLLTLSKFDAQSIEMNKEVFDLDMLVREIVETFKVETQNRGQKLLYNKVNEVPPVLGDTFQIERAVKNIISNSMKYTPEGGEIRVFVGFLYNEVYIKIEDTGIGIPEQDLPHIFERFYRVDKARSREQGGTGLGLAIAKEIIENHGGTIGMESAVGEGTRVTIKFPAG